MLVHQRVPLKVCVFCWSRLSEIWDERNPALSLLQSSMSSNGTLDCWGYWWTMAFSIFHDRICFRTRLPRESILASSQPAISSQRGLGMIKKHQSICPMSLPFPLCVACRTFSSASRYRHICTHHNISHKYHRTQLTRCIQRSQIANPCFVALW